MRCRKIWWSQRGCSWQYGGSLHAALVRLHARKHTPALLHPHARTRTHQCPRLHTHRQKYVIFISFPWQQRFRERASVLRYTYIACIVTLHFVLINTVIYIHVKVGEPNRKLYAIKWLINGRNCKPLLPYSKTGCVRVACFSSVASVLGCTRCKNNSETSSRQLILRNFELGNRCSCYGHWHHCIVSLFTDRMHV